MGSSTSSLSMLTEDILSEYATLTYLSRYEILKLYKIFSELGLDKVSDIDYRVPVTTVEEAFPQLKYNPFKERIFRVFSSWKDDHFSFEDMLDLCSVMSENCPSTVKAAWAFRVFDYDEDGALGEEDLMTVIDRLTNKNVVEKTEKHQIIRTLLEDMDLEANGSIGLLEFQHAIGKMSDFSTAFSFRL